MHIQENKFDIIMKNIQELGRIVTTGLRLLTAIGNVWPVENDEKRSGYTNAPAFSSKSTKRRL